MKIKIAALLTSHNRYEKTLACLKSLFGANLPADHQLSVFLVDDGSTDGTGEGVKTAFPKVNVIQGSGNLFWNGGMRLAWETAARLDEFDFYLWLNDDTLLYKNTIEELLDCHQDSLKIFNSPSIIVGACHISKDLDKFSYGGYTDKGPLIPNGKLQECKYINGNVVLVEQRVFIILGNLSPEYTHSMGDFDYGLRAINSGFHCIITRKYIASCPPNKREAEWCNPKTPLFKRIRLLEDPKGLNLKEYNIFRRKFWGWKWVIFSLKVYLKVIAPSIYNKIKINI